VAERSALALVLGCLFLSGCAPLTPYTSLPKSAPLAERIARYNQFEEKKRPLGFPQFGERKPGFFGDVYLYQLRHFYEASGDSSSARLMADWRPYELGASAGLTLGLGAFVGGAVLAERGGRLWDTGPLVAGASILFGSFILLVWEREHFLGATAKSFNEFMKRDLGLEDVDVFLVPPAQEDPAKLAFLRRF
jgi:hypothetical protein